MQHQVLYQVYIYLTKPCTCRPEAIILIMHILSSQDDLEKYLLSLVKLCSNLKIQKRDCIPWTEKGLYAMNRKGIVCHEQKRDCIPWTEKGLYTMNRKVLYSYLYRKLTGLIFFNTQIYDISLILTYLYEYICTFFLTYIYILHLCTSTYMPFLWLIYLYIWVQLHHSKSKSTSLYKYIYIFLRSTHM